MLNTAARYALLLLSLVHSHSYAATDIETDQLLQQIYNQTALEQQFHYLGRTFTDSGIEMGRSSIPPDQLTQSKINQIITDLQDQYDIDRLKQRAMDVLAQELDQKLLKNLLPMVQQQVWQNGVGLENRAFDPSNMNALDSYVGVQLQEKPPRQERIDLAYQLAEKTGAVDLTINLITFAALNNAKLLVANDKNDLPANIEANIRATMADMRGDYENLVIRQYLYTYRYMSDKQLTDYISLYDNPDIQALNSAVTMALMEAFR